MSSSADHRHNTKDLCVIIKITRFVLYKNYLGLSAENIALLSNYQFPFSLIQ